MLDPYIERRIFRIYPTSWPVHCECASLYASIAAAVVLHAPCVLISITCALESVDLGVLIARDLGVSFSHDLLLLEGHDPRL